MKLKTLCWRCAKYTNEWLGLRIYVNRKGKCFYCRIDYLDKKYGPSQTAKDFRVNGKYQLAPPNNYELLGFYGAIKSVIKSKE